MVMPTAVDCSLDSCKDRSGSTAICVFVSPTHIIFGNCGKAVADRAASLVPAA